MSPNALTILAAAAYGLAAAVAIAFQLAMAGGAPWGAYAMGGRSPGRFPPALRVAAVGQAVIIALIASIVLADAGVLQLPTSISAPSAIWLAVAFSGLSFALNAASRSPLERRVWVPVTAIMLVSSLVVAVT